MLLADLVYIYQRHRTWELWCVGIISTEENRTSWKKKTTTYILESLCGNIACIPTKTISTEYCRADNTSRSRRSSSYCFSFNSSRTKYIPSTTLCATASPVPTPNPTKRKRKQTQFSMTWVSHLISLIQLSTHYSQRLKWKKKIQEIKWFDFFKGLKWKNLYIIRTKNILKPIILIFIASIIWQMEWSYILWHTLSYGWTNTPTPATATATATLCLSMIGRRSTASCIKTWM